MAENPTAEDAPVDDPAPDAAPTESPTPTEPETTNSDTLDIPAQEPTVPDTPPSAEESTDAPVNQSPVVDPLGYPYFGTDDYDDLLSLYFDGMLLDMFAPTDPDDSFTYLEQLCRDGDLPDYYCRRLYGD